MVSELTGPRGLYLVLVDDYGHHPRAGRDPGRGPRRLARPATGAGLPTSPLHPHPGAVRRLRARCSPRPTCWCSPRSIPPGRSPSRAPTGVHWRAPSAPGRARPGVRRGYRPGYPRLLANILHGRRPVGAPDGRRRHQHLAARLPDLLVSGGAVDGLPPHPPGTGPQPALFRAVPTADGLRGAAARGRLAARGSACRARPPDPSPWPPGGTGLGRSTRSGPLSPRGELLPRRALRTSHHLAGGRPGARFYRPADGRRGSRGLPRSAADPEEPILFARARQQSAGPRRGFPGTVIQTQGLSDPARASRRHWHLCRVQGSLCAKLARFAARHDTSSAPSSWPASTGTMGRGARHERQGLRQGDPGDIGGGLGADHRSLAGASASTAPRTTASAIARKVAGPGAEWFLDCVPDARARRRRGRDGPYFASCSISVRAP